MSEKQVDGQLVEADCIQAIQQTNNGLVVRQMDEQLKALVEAVKVHDKKGSITLQLEIAPLKNTPGAVIVTGKVKSNIPEAPSAGSIFYMNDDGGLQKDDPRQMRLFDQENGFQRRTGTE